MELPRQSSSHTLFTVMSNDCAKTLENTSSAKTSQRHCDDGRSLTGAIAPVDAETGVTDNEKAARPSIRQKSHTVTWPPWRRTDGWSGWAGESVGTMPLVPSLVVQAFATGVLDATTYADFSTFASNRTSLGQVH